MSENFDIHRFVTDEKAVAVYKSATRDRPVVYLNTFGNEGEQVQRFVQSNAFHDFTLVTINIKDWDHDMAPWDIPPIAANDTPCTGGADAYLRTLTEKIVPAAEAVIDGKALWRGIAGYSLAGLFAVYSLYRTDMFSCAASMSGSLWYPRLLEFIRTHELTVIPDKMYFSLGDKESRTRNRYLRTVRENTEEIRGYFADKGIATEFVLNEGNHYENAALRTAAGIIWLLEN